MGYSSWKTTLLGEIVASVVTVFVGGVLLYEVVICSQKTSDYTYCQNEFARCKLRFGFQDPCARCLEYCLSLGYWPGSSMGLTIKDQI